VDIGWRASARHVRLKDQTGLDFIRIQARLVTRLEAEVGAVGG
jgi:hypothetical protein